MQLNKNDVLIFLDDLRLIIIFRRLSILQAVQKDDHKEDAAGENERTPLISIILILLAACNNNHKAKYQHENIKSNVCMRHRVQQLLLQVLQLFQCFYFVSHVAQVAPERMISTFEYLIDDKNGLPLDVEKISSITFGLFF